MRSMPSSPGAVIEHRFNGRPFTVGIEEELMLIDPRTLDLAQAIEPILADPAATRGPGAVKPELMQSVLEIATDPCETLAEAAAQVADLRGRVSEAAGRQGLVLGAAGTHPTADWRRQEITDRDRYRDLIEQLSWIAWQELIFGTHVHIGIGDADQAVYVADGIRRHLPVLLAASVNSPLWVGEETGMMSTRTPVFRQFPRVGVPPHYGDWRGFAERVGLLMRAGSIPDYTYLWWDVRPHPNLGTVEVRAFDQQTGVEDTVALAALAVCLAHRYADGFERGEPLEHTPSELIDDCKVRAALDGLEADLVVPGSERRQPAATQLRELVDSLARDAATLGCEAELARAGAIPEAGTGAARQLEVLSREGLDGVVRAAILGG